MGPHMRSVARQRLSSRRVSSLREPPTFATAGSGGVRICAGCGLQLVLDAGNQRPDAGEADLLNRLWPQLGLGKEAGKIEIGLETDVHGEGRNRALDRRHQ